MNNPSAPPSLPQTPLPSPSEWSFDLIRLYHEQIARVAGDFSLETYPVQLEIITADQMMDAYASVGMPVNYVHWSFGKHYLATERSYRRGQMGLAYEIVINSNPCIAYLMEENSLPMQALVIAHAAYGHNSFFRNNYLFRTWTDASSIIDYLVYAKQYVLDCEQRHGIDAVEEILDSCHALMNYGVDRYKRPHKLSLTQESIRREEREAYQQSQINALWRTLPLRPVVENVADAERFPTEPQENLLYFIEKNAPLLEPWQREIVRIVRKIAQYFYPQRQTQVMNEGWACFWHYTILNQLFDEGLLSDAFMLEFLQSHTSVIQQVPATHPGYNGINPYALGFAMMRDIRRICEAPTEEDRRWFPELAGSDWRQSLEFAMRNFRDESFIAQYLSPKLIRDFRFFSVLDDDQLPTLRVEAIHDDEGYRRIRSVLAGQYDISTREPDIQVWNVDVRGDRHITLRHTQHLRRPLNDDTVAVLNHFGRLWRFDVKLETVGPAGELLSSIVHSCDKRH